MPLFPKTVVRFFTNEMECERGKQDFGNKKIVLNATSVLIFEHKKFQRNEFQKILYNWSISITTTANLLRKSLICSPCKSELYIYHIPS